MKHTKGEWFARGHLDVIELRSGFGICFIGNERELNESNYPIEQAEANAKLIAAAPDLLEALKSCKYLIEKLQDDGTISNWNGEIEMNLAIEKATK